MEIVIERSGTSRIVRVSGEIDLATAPRLHQALGEFTAGAGTVIIDLTGVSFIDSSGLNVLMQSRERLTAEGQPSLLRLVVSRPAIQRVFDVTGLTAVFDVFATVDEALQSS